jgi:hypothetical protein
MLDAQPMVPLTVVTTDIISDSRHITTASPRLTIDLSSNVPYTPKGSEADIFKYYCPLCMLYFKNILKGSCCGNYICFTCTKDYVATKGLDHIKTMGDIEINAILFAEITCPNCFTNGFHPIHVRSDEQVRDYSWNDQPGPKYYQASPVRVGESFEDLKRKMISFKQASGVPPNQPPAILEESLSANVPSPMNVKNDASGPRGIAMLDDSPVLGRDHEGSIMGGDRSARDDEHGLQRLSSTATAQTPKQSPRFIGNPDQMAAIPYCDQRDDDPMVATTEVARRLALDGSRRGSRDMMCESGIAFASAKETDDEVTESKDSVCNNSIQRLGDYSIAEAKAIFVNDDDRCIDKLMDPDMIHDNLSEHNDVLEDTEESMLDGSTLTLTKIDIHHSHLPTQFSPRICEPVVEDQEVLETATSVEERKASFFSSGGIRSTSPTNRKYLASEDDKATDNTSIFDHDYALEQ